MVEVMVATEKKLKRFKTAEESGRKMRKYVRTERNRKS